MDSQTERLVLNRLAWKIEGEFWRDMPIEDCVEATHIDRRNPDEAFSRASKIIDAYCADNPTPREKRFFRNNDTIWQRRLDESLEDAISRFQDEIEEAGLLEQSKFLMSP